PVSPACLMGMNRRELFFGAAVAGLLPTLDRAAAQARPIGTLVTVSGSQVHYLQRGKPAGRTVVFLHGMASMIQDFTSSGVLEPLEPDYRILCFDRPGYGYTQQVASQSPEVQADLFASTLQHVGVTSCIVVAHSWGTLVANALALRSPTLVEGLVLLGGYYFSEPAPPVTIGSGGVSPIHAAIAKAFAPLGPTARFTAEFDIDLALGSLQASAVEGASLRLYAGMLETRYDQLRHPLVLLVGEKDGVTGLVQSQKMNAKFPTSTLRIFPGVGHMVHHAHPNEVVAAVRSF
ncbi:MAG TPA: alpha/beta hydrolase, partial [Aestuariivirgaceae bacterium]|nr:alpha/beta hydrolase [Aestuariivirgaceae bacterium]